MVTMEWTPRCKTKITWTLSHGSLAISCRSRQDFIKPVWLARLSNGKASAMEIAPLLVTINEPLTLPCACVQLETIDRGISLHGRDNIGRLHNSGNGLLFALVIDHVAQARWVLPPNASNVFWMPMLVRALLHTHCYEVLGVQTQPPCCVGKV